MDLRIIFGMLFVPGTIRSVIRLQEKPANHKTNYHYGLRFIDVVSDWFFFSNTKSVPEIILVLMVLAVIVWLSFLFFFIIITWLKARL